MVTLRGSKAKASAASRKTVEKTAAKGSKPKTAASPSTSSAHDGESGGSLAALQLPDMTGEERVQRLVAFVTQAGLALHGNTAESDSETASLLKMMERTTVPGFLDAMLVAFCTSTKDRAAPPQQILSRLTAASRKRVCGAIFSADEIAYSCRDCQVDSSCVICRDCFMHGDHVGHDVYFQRTTAGSSCDCGDAHAWKRSGFCTRHPGVEDEQDESSGRAQVTKKSTLPKALASMAPVVIEAVVEFVFQVYLGIDHGFEFANTLAWFTRDIQPSILAEMAEAVQLPPPAAPSSTTMVAASSVRERRRPRQSSTIPAGDESAMIDRATVTASSDASLFAIRLHNDDMHTMDDVINVLSNTMNCTKHSAESFVTETDRFGDTIVAKLSLLKCAGPTGALSGWGLNVSVAPAWWQAQMDTLPSILEWLRTISMASDGLYEIVSEALRKKRSRRLHAPPSVSPFIPTGVSTKDFCKAQGVRLHPTAQDLIAEWAGSSESEVHEWARNVEGAIDQLYQLAGGSSGKVGAVAVPQNIIDNCENVLILEFVKAVCLTKAYSRHKSIRDACAIITARYSHGEHQQKPEPSPSSVLALMVRWDCALRKRTAHLGHALLREHMLNKGFRQNMLETYALSYRAMTQSYLKGLGNSSDSIFDFAVQFLTVPQLVKQYTRSEVEKDPSKPQLAFEILSAMKTVLSSAAIGFKSRNTSVVTAVGDHGLLNVEHPVLTSQKYKHCIDDLEYIFNMGSMPNELVCDQRNLDLWISSLNLIQYGDAQERRGIGKSHVEYESDSWLSMFNLGIRVHSIFPVAWNGIPPELMANRKQVVSRVLLHIVTEAIESSRTLNSSTPVKEMKPIEYLRDASKSALIPAHEVYDFKVAVSPTSLHVPLHRFLASSIRHISLHVSWFQDVLESDGFIKSFALDRLSKEEGFELIELPLRSIVMASQIHSNLWRRNGEENMMAQLYNYSALPCCVHFRDVDVFLLQVGVILLGPNALLSLMVDRFQVGEFFLGPLSAKSSELSPEGMGYARREDGVDEQQEFQMVEELLRLVIILGTSLPSTVGEAFEDAFLEEEMLQHLCAKSSSFSKLFDVAILPTGQDDVSVPRLEQILSRIADFAPPTGLEPGRYELKEGLLDMYNPYFIHLNREAHELARDRWTNYRKARRQRHRAASKTAPPLAPLQRMRRPLPFLRQARGILMCEGTLTLVHTILWKVVQDASPRENDSQQNHTSGGAISDAVISTTLHLLVYGVYAAEEADEDKDPAGNAFWTAMCQPVPALSGLSLVSAMWTLADSSNAASSSLDEEQSSTLQWLMWKIRNCSTACAALIDQLEKKDEKVQSSINPTTSGCASSTPQPVLTLEQRKEEARKRALEAMARQQAAFQAMMANMDDEEDEEEGGEDVPPARVELGSDDSPLENPSSLRKRRASTEDGSALETDDVKRARLDDTHHEEDESCYKCILCHDTSKQGEMGVAAYVHQSTVLSGSFRPEADEALQPRGAEVRKQVKVLIEKMDLCSGTSEPSSDSPSPPFRTLAGWHIDDELDELLLDSPIPHLNLIGGMHRQLRQMNGGTFGDNDAALQALEGVLNLREDQRLFPLPVNAAGVSPDRRDRGTQRPRGIFAVRRGGPPVMDLESDFDEDEDEEFNEDDHHDHHHHHHHHNHRHHLHSPGRSRSGSNTTSLPLFLTPCGLHIRTCQHAVHIDCLERYIRSLHEKAIRGEEFDGVQAIDPDSAMTQFLCPLCKTLCNFLLPTSDPGAASGPQPMMIEDGVAESSTPSAWHAIVNQQLDTPGWYRSVFGRDGGQADEDADSDIHDLWRDYFEETLWEPHGSLEKGAPFLWSACAFSLASFLNVAEEEYRNSSKSGVEYDPLTDSCPASLEQEFASLVHVTKFCRWSFSLLEHSGDAKVIWETCKRCCPINTETKREYRKFTKVLGSIDACLRGTILGLLVADTFTAFVVSSVIADSLSTIWQFIPVFSAADLLQRVYTEFFVQSKNDERSLLQDKFSIIGEDSASTGSADGSIADEDDGGRPRRSTRSSTQPSHDSGTRTSKSRKSKSSTTANSRDAKDTIRAMQREFTDSESDESALLALLLRILESDPDETLKPLTKKDLKARLQHIQSNNAILVRRMKLFWRCLSKTEQQTDASASQLQIPSLAEVAASPNDVFEQVWKWCVDRMNSKSFLGIAKNGDKCEHAEGCGEGYIASMFILRDQASRPRLIDLPVQYDVLYSMMSGRKCTRCDRTPCDPGICLICGEFVCCGDSCCTRPFVTHGPQVGESTRHAAECGGGIGIVLQLDQCRVAIIGGSMAAYFPCPYVDAHGEEDVGLQRGRPLRLDMVRYRHLESLWLNHRIFSEVSRQRNQREPQYTIDLSYL